MSKKSKGHKDLTPKSAKLKSITSLEQPPKWTICPLCGLRIPEAQGEAEENLTEISGTEISSSRHATLLPQAVRLKVFKPEQGENKASSWMHSKEPIFINTQMLVGIQGTVGSPVIINSHFVGFLSLASDAKYLDYSIGACERLVERVRERFHSEFVLIQRIPLPFMDAKEIHVLLLNASLLGVDPEFLKFAKANLLLEFVTAGSEKTFSFMGRILKIRVMKIIGVEGEMIEYKQSGSVCTCLGQPDSLESKRFFQIVRSTKVNWSTDTELSQNGKILDSFGVYDSQRTEITKFMKHSTLAEHDEFCSSGLLVYGPSGVGKTLLIRTLASSLNISLFEISISDLNQCSSESKARCLVERMVVHEPCILVFDKLNIFCSNSNPLPKDSSWNYTDALVNVMDFMRRTRRRVFFIGITNKFGDIHRDLLDPMRFGVRVEIGCPAVEGRSEIFKSCLESITNKLSNSDIMKISEETHGFVAHDFITVCDIASGELRLSRKWMTDVERGVDVIGFNDVMAAVKIHKRVLMQESALAVCPVQWDDIGGQHELKNLLKRIVESAVSGAYDRGSSWSDKGILLFGPPGCCKTMIARAVATQCSTNFFAVQGPELLSKYVGESERMVRELFSNARLAAPAVIFFDEIDAIAGPRDGGENDVTSGVLSTLLTEIGGIQSLNGVALIASTNLPTRLDPALLIPSRLGKHCYVRLPDPDARREILQLQFRCRPVAGDVDLEELVLKTEGFSGAELVGLCSKAASLAMIEDLSAAEIKHAHFLSTLGDIVPLATQDMLDMYEKFASGSYS